MPERSSGIARAEWKKRPYILIYANIVDIYNDIGYSLPVSNQAERSKPWQAKRKQSRALQRYASVPIKVAGMGTIPLERSARKRMYRNIPLLIRMNKTMRLSFAAIASTILLIACKKRNEHGKNRF